MTSTRQTRHRRHALLAGRAWQARGAALVVVVGLALAACGSDAASPPSAGRSAPDLAKHASLVRANVPMSQPAAGLSLTGLSTGMDELGYQLARRLDGDADSGNLVYSPASLAIAFAMVREGATGAAAQQIDSVLGLPANRQQAFNALIRSVEQPGSGNTLKVGDAIFTHRGYPIAQPFLTALQKWYGAGVYQTTFPDQGKAAVNAYVAKQTDNLIPKLVTDEFDQDTVMSLVNTLYLNAHWAQPFDENLTSMMPFTTRDGSQVKTKTMMRHQEQIDYAAGVGWQAVRLPYRGDRLSMVVLVPTGQASPVSLLDPKVVQAASSGFAPAAVDLSLPRWSFGTKAALGPMLESMGLSAPFAPGGFPNLTSDPNFALDSVIQQARITVGEKGTVAAATSPRSKALRRAASAASRP